MSREGWAILFCFSLLNNSRLLLWLLFRVIKPLEQEASSLSRRWWCISMGQWQLLDWTYRHRFNTPMEKMFPSRHQSTVLYRCVSSLFGPIRKSSPWGSFFQRWILRSRSFRLIDWSDRFIRDVFMASLTPFRSDTGEDLGGGSYQVSDCAKNILMQWCMVAIGGRKCLHFAARGPVKEVALYVHRALNMYVARQPID